MRKKILLVLLAVFVILIVFVAYTLLTTRSHSPQDTAVFMQGEFEASIVYCQPYKKGRMIFGPEGEALVPYGLKWRTGANEATTLSLNKDAVFGGQPLPKGEYTLYTIPGPTSWTIAINSRTDYWGAGLSDPFQEEYDVLRVSREVVPLDSTAEQFYIRWEAINEGTAVLRMFWDETLVELPVLWK